MANFKVQRGTISFAGDTTTVSITAVSSTSKAICRLTGVQKSNGGITAGSSSSRDNDDLGATIEFESTSSLRIRRYSTGATAHNYSWEVWEYTGAAGDLDEFVVRWQGVLTLANAVAAASQSQAVTDPSKCVPFITGMRNNRVAMDWEWSANTANTTTAVSTHSRVWCRAAIALAAGITILAVAAGWGRNQRDSSATRPGMVLVPGGTFVMGSNEDEITERPAHSVTVAAFWIDKYEVSVGEFRRFVQTTGYRTEAEVDGYGIADLPYFPAWRRRRPESAGTFWANVPTFWTRSTRHTQRDDEPVVLVSWNDAAAYAQWAGKRLPTEQEWEFAARGLDARRYVWGHDMPPKHRVGNFLDEVARRHGYEPSSAAVDGFEDSYVEGYEDGFVFTAPVGSFPLGTSPFGCQDMAGNVWEWTADWYLPYHSIAGSSTLGRYRVVRGGAWDDGPARLYAARRNALDPSDREHCVGFRCVADVDSW